MNRKAPWRGPLDLKWKYSNIFSLKALFKDFDKSVNNGDTKELAVWLNNRQPISEDDLQHDDPFIRTFAQKYYKAEEVAAVQDIRVPGSWNLYLDGIVPEEGEPIRVEPVIKKPRKARVKKVIANG